MVLTIYDKFYSIENMNGNKTWYKAEKDSVSELKKIFTEAQEANKQEEKEAGTTEEVSTENSENDLSHSREIQEESMMESEESEE